MSVTRTNKNKFRNEVEWQNAVSVIHDRYQLNKTWFTDWLCLDRFSTSCFLHFLTWRHIKQPGNPTGNPSVFFVAPLLLLLTISLFFSSSYIYSPLGLKKTNWKERGFLLVITSQKTALESHIQKRTVGEDGWRENEREKNTHALTFLLYTHVLFDNTRLICVCFFFSLYYVVDSKQPLTKHIVNRGFRKKIYTKKVIFFFFLFLTPLKRVYRLYTKRS